MNVNDDFSQRVLLHTEDLPWVDSPMAGVQRRPLDRIGDEVARATTVVRYAPGSSFSSHVHTGGEEFLVLDGVFQDEHGDFPAGSYIRNPPQSSHTPGSEPGCTILVKLWQFDLDDRTHVRVDLGRTGSVEPADRPGVRVTPLFEDARETVVAEQWQPDTRVQIDPEGGLELYVIEGSLQESGEEMTKGSWLRLPIGRGLDAVAGPEGARVWMKTGHLRFVAPPGV